MMKDTLYARMQNVKAADKFASVSDINVNEWCALGTHVSGNRNNIASIEMAVSATDGKYWYMVRFTYVDQSGVMMVPFRSHDNMTENKISYIGNSFTKAMRAYKKIIKHLAVRTVEVNNQIYHQRLQLNIQGIAYDDYIQMLDRGIEAAGPLMLRYFQLKGYSGYTLEFKTGDGKYVQPFLIEINDCMFYNRGPIKIPASLGKKYLTQLQNAFPEITFYQEDIELPANFDRGEFIKRGK